MPNIKSAKKRLRQNEARRVENLEIKTRMKTFRRKFLESLESGSDSAGAYSKYCSALDKAVKKGVIKKNTAVRNKSRAASKLRAAV